MDTFAFGPPSPASSGTAADGDRNPRRRDRLAIVSTTDELCGVASYTKSLREQLSADFDVTVFDLDQYLMRGRNAPLRAAADRHIAGLCRELARFDAVNLQLEHGTLGWSAKDIYRRFSRLVAASPRLCVTFHTLVPPLRFRIAEFAKAAIRFDWNLASQTYAEFRRHRLLSLTLARRLRRAQRAKQVTAIVHTRRNYREVRYLYGLDNVFDHPLTFLSADEVRAIRHRAARRNFPMLDHLPGGATLIGVFGFINDYKGLGTVVRALRHLPENHHLLIFGGIHPNEIVAKQPIHPYLSGLFDEAFVDATPYDQIGDRPEIAAKLVLGLDHGLDGLIGRHPRDLSGRIHFMGAPGHGDFLCGMANCDAVVFPYMEVGQSASGPISQALELGCRIIASRTRTFLSFGEYHREAIEFFDIGNHLELAERILARRQFASRDGLPAYNAETNRAVYFTANSRLPQSPLRSRDSSFDEDGAAVTAPQGSTAQVRAVRGR